MLRRLAFLFLLAATVVACKQGEGERCQVDSDCEDGLTCTNAAPHTCEKIGSDPEPETPDAEVPDGAPADAEPIDAMPIDAMPIDAPPI